ncbi:MULTISPECIES: multicopper oxidase family protein [unclassified Streptomyces]|uniref:multicopper oxidase family protein n=1 Tax=unclassified Streptomyces TaxID=2593676 RepID=UPI001BE61639|nr:MULTISPECIES: multicopper oxidase domain-containing protein [unclassified Streptomyces]MBT2402002.1 multicopper oxidase domain-containing protein [Streptomyces sp. ISL-21]MBT2454249.1 multicopper oxidase domain-containing protein [Streptomyces sp. ISL-86]MBT2609488.1 multicopper oxidase domain-containing protein [Streptomyces sp. ISL-87]
MATRRTVLRASLVTAGAGAFTGAALTPLLARPDAEAATVAPAGAAALAVEKFKLAMPIPPVLTPYSTADGVDRYLMTMKPARKEIVPGFQTDVLTYNGSFPGPTIRARSGRTVEVLQVNNLDMPTSVHLHGASVAPENDGSPMETIEPGDVRSYTYPNKQPHASLWYHDHAHHMESEHVYRGLAGSYLITDAVEQGLSLPSGAYDVPIAIRDAGFDDTGQLVYKMNDFDGRDTLLANGKAYPYFQVAARKYRFRLLDSSNLRSFTLRLADGSELIQIGSDGGLLPKPFRTDSVELSPGERADIVIDFSRYPVGTKIVLENTNLGGGPVEKFGQVLRFDVVRTAADTSQVPSVLRTLPALPTPTAERSVVMRMDESDNPNAPGYLNDKVYDPERIDAFIRHGASEVWTITNVNTFLPHNFHMHLVQFRVIERNGKAPGPAESGLKDTVWLMPGDTVKVQATFDTYRGTYLYHCHLIDHSAMGMMAQFKVT